MTGLARNQHWDQVVEGARDIRLRGDIISQKTFSTIFKLCQSNIKAEPSIILFAIDLFKDIQRSGVIPDTEQCNMLLSMLVASPENELGEDYTNTEAAITLFKDMPCQGIERNEQTYRIMLQFAASSEEWHQEAVKLYHEVDEVFKTKSPELAKAQIEAAIKIHRIDLALKPVAVAIDNFTIEKRYGYIALKVTRIHDVNALKADLERNRRQFTVSMFIKCLGGLIENSASKHGDAMQLLNSGIPKGGEPKDYYNIHRLYLSEITKHDLTSNGQLLERMALATQDWTPAQELYLTSFLKRNVMHNVERSEDHTRYISRVITTILEQGVRLNVQTYGYLLKISLAKYTKGIPLHLSAADIIETMQKGNKTPTLYHFRLAFEQPPRAKKSFQKLLKMMRLQRSIKDKTFEIDSALVQRLLWQCDVVGAPFTVSRAIMMQNEGKEVPITFSIAKSFFLITEKFNKDKEFLSFYEENKELIQQQCHGVGSVSFYVMGLRLIGSYLTKYGTKGFIEAENIVNNEAFKVPMTTMHLRTRQLKMLFALSSEMKSFVSSNNIHLIENPDEKDILGSKKVITETFETDSNVTAKEVVDEVEAGTRISGEDIKSIDENERPENVENNPEMNITKTPVSNTEILHTAAKVAYYGYLGLVDSSCWTVDSIATNMITLLRDAILTPSGRIHFFLCLAEHPHAPHEGILRMVESFFKMNVDSAYMDPPRKASLRYFSIGELPAAGGEEKLVQYRTKADFIDRTVTKEENTNELIEGEKVFDNITERGYNESDRLELESRIIQALIVALRETRKVEIEITDVQDFEKPLQDALNRLSIESKIVDGTVKIPRGMIRPSLSYLEAKYGAETRSGKKYDNMNKGGTLDMNTNDRKQEDRKLKQQKRRNGKVEIRQHQKAQRRQDKKVQIELSKVTQNPKVSKAQDKAESVQSDITERKHVDVIDSKPCLVRISKGHYKGRVGKLVVRREMSHIVELLEGDHDEVQLVNVEAQDLIFLTPSAQAIYISENTGKKQKDGDEEIQAVAKGSCEGADTAEVSKMNNEVNSNHRNKSNQSMDLTVSTPTEKSPGASDSKPPLDEQKQQASSSDGNTLAKSGKDKEKKNGIRYKSWDSNKNEWVEVVIEESYDDNDD
eukprot:CAMPEP_0167759324 /NCGR_PEP_ID=MMETSP0110_2-20121227/10959_1 /TAXON_ID=629695 /ORGANISM="Gymnochlora sp., Strain CCMP2014" /LENGTH=1132 /DNA_ID=CAMNT_0007645695 /DNA_START=534 /DNA_END=3932 /DNA_ORIENTATION=+